MNTYPPTAEELRKYLHARRVNGFEVADLLQVGRRTVGYWMAGYNASAKRDVTMPFSCWFTLRTRLEGTPPIASEHDAAYALLKSYWIGDLEPSQVAAPDSINSAEYLREYPNETISESAWNAAVGRLQDYVRHGVKQ